MDPVFVTALAGIAGVLLGTIGSGLVGLLAERRRENAQARVAAGFVQRELHQNSDILEAALNKDRWWPPENAPTFDAWEKWGPALLTGYPRAGARTHETVRALGSVDRLARLAYEPFDTAERHIARIEAGRPVDRKGEESEEAARKRALDKAKQDRNHALAKLELGANRSNVEGAKTQVDHAFGDIPGSTRMWVHRAVPWAVALLLVVVAVVALDLVRQKYDDATVSAEEVASVVGDARGAELASCDAVKDVDDSFSCRLSYVADVDGCDLSAHSSASRALASADLGGRHVRLAGAAGANCAVEATSSENVHVDTGDDDDPRWEFQTELAELAVNGMDKQERQGLLAKWRARLPRIVIGTSD